MKLKKIISAVAAFAMMASVANAAVVFEYDDGYYIDNVADVADRNVGIETTVKQMTSDEVVALGNSNPTAISSKKLKNATTGYANTTLYTVYEVTGTFTGVGELGVGYDRNDNKAYIQLALLTASTDLNGVTYEAAGLALSSEAVTGTTWTGGGVTNGVMATTLDLTTAAYPSSTEDTAEGALIDKTYSFKQYYVMPAGHADVTIPYSNGSLGVGYYIYNADEGKTNDLVKVLINDQSFTLAEAKTTTDVEIAGVATADYEKTGLFEKDGAQYYHAAFKKAITVDKDSNNPVAGIKIKGDKEATVTFKTAIEDGTVNVAINILDVPADVTLGALTITPFAN